MRRLFYGTTAFLFLSMLFVACQNESAKTPSSASDEKVDSNRMNKHKEVTATCHGNCDETSVVCGMQGVIVNDKSYMECNCSGCRMEVTVVKGTKSKAADKKESRVEVYYLEVFQNYMKEHYGAKKYTIVKYHFATDGKENVETYFFDLGDEKTGSILIAGAGGEMAKPPTKVKVIDCTGTCDCREQYDFEQNKASCSCSDCQMSVTIVKIKGDR